MTKSTGSRFFRFGALTAILATAVVLASASIAGGQDVNIGVFEEQRLDDPALGGGDRFGAAIDIDDDTLVIGVPFSSAPGRAGSVYIYSRTDTGWVEQQMLSVDNLPDNHRPQFGASVALEGNVLVVGSPNFDRDGFGAAHVFVRDGDTWIEQQLLVIEDPPALFGSTVAISGDTIVVEAGPSIDDEGRDLGRTLVFTRENNRFEVTQEILVEASGVGFLGQEVALDGDTLIIGRDDVARVFSRTDDLWIESQQLTITARFFTGFAEAVALDADTLVVTVELQTESTGIAQVYILEDGTWIEQDQLFIPETEATGILGRSIDLDGDSVVVSEEGTLGAAHLFTRSGDTWTYEAKFVGSDVQSNRGNNAAVAIGGNDIILGLPRTNGGDAYVFDANARGVLAACNGQTATVDLANGDLPTDGDDVIIGTEGPDVINAGAGNDVICSGSGADVINAGPGADIIFAGDGDDVVRAGDGADVVRGGNGDDQIFAGQGRDQVRGEAGDDFISGGKGKDLLIGGSGSDDLRGNEGTDDLRGSSGDDELRGGQKADVLQGNGCLLYTSPSPRDRG